VLFSERIVPAWRGLLVCASIITPRRRFEKSWRSNVAVSTTREGAIRGVTVRGRAEFLADSPERRMLAARFLEKYEPRLERLWGGRAMPPDRVLFRIVPERVRSWGLA